VTASGLPGPAAGARARALVRDHPCYSETAHHRWARLHLPVAPRCNIACAYCDRRVSDCLHVTRPGLTSRIVRTAEVPSIVRAALEAEPRLRVVGVAGPGEPLANPETLPALAAAKREAARVGHPGLVLCLATNGLRLPDLVGELARVGVTAVTVTVNTVRPEVATHIYLRVGRPLPGPARAGGSSPAWSRNRVQGGGSADRAAQAQGMKSFRPVMAEEGAAGAAVASLIECQLRGIRLAAAAGMAVKVNTVLIPGVNDRCAAEVAAAAAERGALIQNIVPLLPLGAFSDRRAPTCSELRRARAEAGRHLPQFRLCRQCRADAMGVPGEEERA